MNYKMTLYLFVLLIFLSATLGVVSAVENSTDLTSEVLSVIETSTVQEEILEISNEEIVSANEGSFSELQTLIDSNRNGIINLNKDYSYKNGDPTTGIVINKNLVINGNNFTLDGKIRLGCLIFLMLQQHLIILNLSMVLMVK